jgi:SAM-dependent methyltransferase
MHAILFADWGYRVVGTDLSVEMIKNAKANARRSNSKVRFARAGFGQLGSELGGHYDAVTCLGNSLPHLLTKDDLKMALHDIHSVLAPGGIFVTQNRNYDKVWSERNRFMPLEAASVGEKEHLFLRILDFYQDTIGFNIVTLTKDEGKWSYVVRSTMHRPIFQGELEALLREVGFTETFCYGDYQQHDFVSSDSVDLIVVARKGQGKA